MLEREHRELRRANERLMPLVDGRGSWVDREGSVLTTDPADA